MAPTENSPNVLSLAKLDGAVARLVERPDGGAVVETWDGAAWREGGADVASVLKAPEPTAADLAELGISA